MQALIDRLNRGDTSARGELLALTRDRLKRTVSRKLHALYGRLEEKEQPSDVVQDFCVDLLDNWDRFLVFRDREQGKDVPLTTARQYYLQAAGWIRRILVDLCRKHFGRLGNRPLSVPLEGGSDEQGTGYEPDTWTDNPERLEAFKEFHEAVEKLPGGLREVVDLRYYQGMTHARIARILGIAEVTAKVRWAKARAALVAAYTGGPFTWAEFAIGGAR